MLGRDGRHRVYASWEDTLLAVMPPRAGKTACVAIPTVFDAPGAVIATSNKRDLYDASANARGQRGPVWRFDPQAIVSTDQDIWWEGIRCGPRSPPPTGPSPAAHHSATSDRTHCSL